MLLSNLFKPPHIKNLEKKGKVGKLIEALEYKKDENVRVKAVEALARIKYEQAVDSLIDVLKNDNEAWRVRKAAAQALGQIKSAKAMEPLIGVLKTPHPSAQEPTAEVEGGIGNTRAAENDIRETAARSLGKIKGEKAEDALIDVLKNDRAWTVCKVIVEVLGNIGGTPAVNALLHVLNDEKTDTNVREAAVKALAQISDSNATEQLIDVLRKDNAWRIRKAAAEALGKIGGLDAVEPLIEVLDYLHPDAQKITAGMAGGTGDARTIKEKTQVRQTVVEALGEIGSVNAVDSLLDVLNKGESLAMRESAAKALGRIKNKQAAPALIEVLKENSTTWHVREATAEALGRIRETTTVNLLIGLLNASYSDIHENTIEAEERTRNAQLVKVDNPRVRRAIAGALGEIGDSRAVKLLINALEGDTEWRVREAAARALGQIENANAVDALTKVFKSKDNAVTWQVRKAVVEALGRIGGTKAAELLINLLKSSYPGKQEVQEVTGKVTEKVNGPHSDMHGNTTEVEKKTGDAQIMQVNDPHIRRAIVESLGEIGDSRAVDPLITVLKTDIDDEDMLESAAKALGRIGNAQVVIPLIDILKKAGPAWRAREAAIEALGSIGDMRAVEPLSTVLEGPYPPKSRSVLKALEQIGGARAQEAIANYRGKGK